MYLVGLESTEKPAFYALAKHLAKADEGVLSEERDVLDLFKQELGLQDEPAEISVEDACREFASTASQRIALLELLLLAYSDGDIGPNEKKLLDRVAVAFGMAQTQFANAQVWAQGMNALNRSGLRFIRG